MASTDRELWRRAVAGERDAFAELYDRHADAIYNYCFRRCADWSAAEDLTAVVFLEAWRKRRGVAFDREDAVLPWLYGVAGNSILMLGIVAVLSVFYVRKMVKLGDPA